MAPRRLGMGAAMAALVWLGQLLPAGAQSYEAALKEVAGEVAGALNRQLQRGQQVWVAPFADELVGVACEPLARDLQTSLLDGLIGWRERFGLSFELIETQDVKSTAAVVRGFWRKRADGRVGLALRLGDTRGAASRQLVARSPSSTNTAATRPRRSI